MLTNIAPMLPDAVLTTIERVLQAAAKATAKKCTYLARLLRSLAYESALFERATALLIQLAQVADTDDEHDREPVSILTSLFYIALSGTHAPVAMRLKVLQSLLQSNDAWRRALGVNTLEAMLRTQLFSAHYSFEFGALSRDYGYEPRGNDVQDWFDAVMAVAAPLALSDSPVALDVRKCIAGEFRGLWMNAGQANALENLAKEIVAKGFWRDGWIAARRTRIYSGKHMPPDVLARLIKVEELLRPKDLVDRVRGVVLDFGGGSLDLEIDDMDRRDFAGAGARMSATIEKLGKDVAVDDDAFKTLLPSLIRGGSRVRPFGDALASSTDKPYEVWQALLNEFTKADGARTSIIAGFLNGLRRRDAALADRLLDEALEHPSAGPCFPELQASVTIDARGIERLHRALDLGMAPISQFYTLAEGGASDNIPGPAFRDLLLAIARKSGGNNVALEIV